MVATAHYNVDRNPQTPQRKMRNWQRLRKGAVTGSISLLAAGGLQFTSNSLSLKLTDTSLVLASSGVAVNLRTSSGLQISAGLGILLNGTSLALGASGLLVNLRTNGGLTISSGLGVLLQSNSGLLLQVAGLTIQLVSPSGLSLGASGLAISVDSTGTGLSIGSGGLKYTSPITTKGDLIVGVFNGSGNPPTRVAVGANDTILTADSTVNAGLAWKSTANLTAYKVSGTQVVGAQGAAVADATGAGDVVAQLNALLARIRTHGLIAP